VLAVLPAVTGIHIAWADPDDPADVAGVDVAGPPAPRAPGPAPVAAPVMAESDNAISAACKQFGAALNLAALNYEDFAYATAGNGNTVDYRDPTVWRSNVVGRTALREAAAAALSASRAPGLPPEVSDPMQSWSVHATKLVLIMGLHGGGDSLNSTANQLNADAHDGQLACALNGGRA
jgi:hypothetical protein